MYYTDDRRDTGWIAARLNKKNRERSHSLPYSLCCEWTVYEALWDFEARFGAAEPRIQTGD